MVVLMRHLDRMIGAKDLAGCDAALRSLPVDRLTPSLLVGALTIVIPVTKKLPGYTDFYQAVRARLTAEMPERVDRVLHGINSGSPRSAGPEGR
jgi:hypothetical protein